MYMMFVMFCIHMYILYHVCSMSVCIHVMFCIHHITTIEWESFAEENFKFLSEMQFSWFYFRVFTATVRVGNSLDEFSRGEIFPNSD